MQLAIFGQSRDVQCKLGIRGYSDSGYICSWLSSDNPGMYNVSWESADTLTGGIIYAVGHPRTVPGCTM